MTIMMMMGVCFCCVGVGVGVGVVCVYTHHISLLFSRRITTISIYSTNLTDIANKA
jgi:hypothetical protein